MLLNFTTALLFVWLAIILALNATALSPPSAPPAWAALLLILMAAALVVLFLHVLSARVLQHARNAIQVFS